MKAGLKSTQDLHQKKLNKGSILVLDLASLPREHGLDLATWVELIKEQGIAFYDSTKGNAPFYTNDKQTIVTYDVQEEKAMSKLEAILKEEDIKYKKVEDTAGRSTTLEDVIVGLNSGEGAPSEGIDEASVRLPVSGNIYTSGTTEPTPLTDQEVTQLGVVDPRGTNLELSTQENDIIDSTMATLASTTVQQAIEERPGRRERRHRAGFESTDDTE